MRLSSQSDLDKYTLKKVNTDWKVLRPHEICYNSWIHYIEGALLASSNGWQEFCLSVSSSES